MENRRIVNILILIAIFLNPVLVSAKDKTVTEQLSNITEQIEYLQTLITQRQDFNTLGSTEKSEEDPDYFSVLETSFSSQVFFGNEKNQIQLQTDGSVDQILVVMRCDESTPVRLNQQNKCVEETWFSISEFEEGVKTFTIPVSFYNPSETEKIPVELYACRFNGCQLEISKNLIYKKEATFSDLLKIYDRYEWEYEWNNNIYHVQEVLLSFPTIDIKKVKLEVDCEAKGIYIKTTEKDRASCNNKREYSELYFGEQNTDEEGNLFNLRIESVTNNIQPEDAGKVIMNFTFINKQNRVVHEVSYRPVQRDS